jgi:hypothetical protein
MDHRGAFDAIHKQSQGAGGGVVAGGVVVPIGEFEAIDSGEIEGEFSGCGTWWSRRM